MKEVALPPTPLLLRFFSVPLSPDRPKGLLVPLRFSPLPDSSDDLAATGELVLFELMGDCASDGLVT